LTNSNSDVIKRQSESEKLDIKFTKEVDLMKLEIQHTRKYAHKDDVKDLQDEVKGLWATMNDRTQGVASVDYVKDMDMKLRTEMFAKFDI
jgi:hypothetical protein